MYPTVQSTNTSLFKIHTPQAHMVDSGHSGIRGGPTMIPSSGIGPLSMLSTQNFKCSCFNLY